MLLNSLSNNSNIFLIWASISVNCLFPYKLRFFLVLGMSGNFVLSPRHFEYYVMKFWVCWILRRMFILLFEQFRFKLQVIMCLLWAVASVSVQCSNPLWCCSDLFHLCATWWPLWDLGSDLFVQLSNYSTCWLESDPCNS